MIPLNTTPSLPSTYSVAESEGQGNASGFLNDVIVQSPNVIRHYLVSILLLVICVFGLVGNVTVLWYLCFIIKKNPITTYVLNLAAADSAVLICLTFTYLLLLKGNTDLSQGLFVCFFLMYSSSQYLLTAISVERCLSVIFPIWYRCHHPKYLSAVFCALLWIMRCLFLGLLLLFVNVNFSALGQSIFIINFMLCIPLVITSTVILIIRVCCSLHREQYGRFYIVILVVLLVFLVFASPLSIVLIYGTFEKVHPMYLLISMMGACINSAVNPLIYFLIGRKRMHQSKESFKLVLQRVFHDNVDYREDEQPT